MKNKYLITSFLLDNNLFVLYFYITFYLLCQVKNTICYI